MAINFHRARRDTHPVKGLAPDAEACGGIEEPQEGVAEDVHEHGETADGFWTAQYRELVVLQM